MFNKLILPLIFPLRDERAILHRMVETGVAPATLHREKIQTISRHNRNFAGNDPTAYMPTDKSLNEVLLG